MSAKPAQQVEMIPIDKINVLNPRERNKRIFNEIVNNIEQIGLKRPITVSRRRGKSSQSYDLVCGQGRLEAYQALGQQEVPALIVTADIEDCLVASLVENCARRHHQAIDLFQDITAMRRRGNSFSAVAKKTGLSLDFVKGVSRLLEKGEQRLLNSVENRTIPITVAVEIANADDHGVQRALATAYEKGLLKGKKLLAAKRLVEMRRKYGKSLLGSSQTNNKKPLSATALVKAYQEETERKKAIIRRTETARNRLLFITEAIRKLSKDEQFFALLEDEDLASIPENIAARLNNEPVEAH